MPKRVLVYIFHNPWPPKTGEHVRYIQMLTGLLKAGYEVSVASSTLLSETAWTKESCSGLKDFGVKEVYVHAPGKWEKRCNKIERLIQRHCGWKPSLVEERFYPVFLRYWFKRLVDKIRPDVLYLTHCWSDQLVGNNNWQDSLKIIEAQFLISLHKQLETKVNLLIERFKKDRQSEEVFNVEMCLQEIWKPNLEELKCYDRYSSVISISQYNKQLLEQHLKHAKVSWIPMIVPGTVQDNNYSGNALFMVGPNPFNLQGLLFLIHKILPLILKKAPDFCLDLTGVFKDELAGVSGTRHLGFVNNLSDLYRSASICICPVFVNTGQQIKIVEGMANGLPVVAMRGGAVSSPLVHKENGFVANNADEFADYVLQLWQDRALCKQMGTSARETLRFWADKYDSSLTFRDIIM